MKNFLFVARDIMSARIQIPVINLLKKAGCTVSIVAEGRAVSVFDEAGLPLYFRGADKIESVDALNIIKKTETSIVCVGTSIPINWENVFGKLANKINLPVATFSDTWGAYDRIGFYSNIIFSIDDAEGKKAAGIGYAEKHATIGDIASEVSVAIDDEKRRGLCEICQGKTSVLIVGDNLNNVEEVVKVVTSCIRWEKNPDDFVIFGSFVHPKLVNEPEVKYILEKVSKMLERFNFVKHQEIGVNTDQLAGFCDYTATSFSTSIRVAVHNGKRGLAVYGEKSSKLMWEETGFKTHPLVDSGVLQTIYGDELIPKLPWEKCDQTAKAWTENARFRPEVAVEKLLALALK